MKVEDLSLSAIKPYEKNPRKNDGAVDGVAESIKQFGFQQPIVVDSKNVIVVGQQIQIEEGSGSASNTGGIVLKGLIKTRDITVNNYKDPDEK